MKKRYGSDLPNIYASVRDGKVRTVGELWRLASSKNPELEFEDFLTELNTSVSEGLLEIEEPSIRSFGEYVRSWRYGFRAWLVIFSVVLGLILVEALQVGYPLVIVRWIAGTYLILIAPGFTLAWALFPSRRQLAGLNRLALTIALSLFLVPAIGLLLNYTPLGIHAEPVAEILAALSLALLYVGMRREFTAIARRT
jgi:hypothetical protein